MRDRLRTRTRTPPGSPVGAATAANACHRSQAAIALLLWAAAVPALAQAPPTPASAAAPAPLATTEAPVETITGPWLPRSGDAWIDRHLTDINTYGARYRGAFIDEVVRYHAAPRALVEALLDAQGWLPGDVYAACALANIAGRPCRAAVALRDAAPGDGWGTIALDLGLEDPSAAAKRLRQAITASYAHWARPEAPELPDQATPDPAARSGSR